MLIRPAWRFLPCSQIRPQMWQLGKRGGEARAGGWGPWRSNFPQISNKICNYSECVISPGAKHKSSTKLHTIWSHVLDRSAKVLNKLIIPLSVLHTFFHYRRWRAGKVQCPAVCQLLAKWKNSAGHWGEVRPSMLSPLACCVFSRRERSLRRPSPWPVGYLNRPG